MVDQLWLEMRQGWRNEVTASLNSHYSGADYAAAFGAVAILRDKKMSLDRKTNETMRDTALKYRQGKAEADEATGDWEAAAAEWQQIYDLQPLDAGVRARLRCARKNACKDQVRRARRQHKPDDALKVLRDALTGPLEGDGDLMLLLAETCIEDTQDFEEADRQLPRCALHRCGCAQPTTGGDTPAGDTIGACRAGKGRRAESGRQV